MIKIVDVVLFCSMLLFIFTLFLTISDLSMENSELENEIIILNTIINNQNEIIDKNCIIQYNYTYIEYINKT